MPKAVNKPHVPKPLFINTAILGENLAREPEGGFAGRGGGWTATKWFPEHDGHSGEVYFNYNLGKRLGEFSEKDADYADGLLAIFASALRDGPRPERTPENDPNLTRTGPIIGLPRKLLSRLASHYTFSPKGRFAVYQNGSEVLALGTDKGDGNPFRLARFDHSPWEIRVPNDDLDLLVQEGVPEKPGSKSSADPMRIWWVDHKSKEKKLLKGPEKDFDLAEAPVSPDYRGCLFAHVEPWLDPHKVEDLWYFDGPPDSPEKLARSFAAVPHRVLFIGHMHRWLLGTPSGILSWRGEQRLCLDRATRYLVVVHAVWDGKCALFDTETGELTPFGEG